MKKIPLLCQIGLHYPIKPLHYLFTDIVIGAEIYEHECPCKTRWMNEKGKQDGKVKITRDSNNLSDEINREIEMLVSFKEEN